jgi:hypothetical protein
MTISSSRIISCPAHVRELAAVRAGAWRAFALAGAALLLLSCTEGSEQLLSPGDGIPAQQDELSLGRSGSGRGHNARISLSPDTALLRPGGVQSFAVQGTGKNGSSISVTWDATGGTISSGGVFTAGKTPGKYRVRATSSTGGSDSAQVIIAAVDTTGTITDVMISPDSATVAEGATQAFTVAAYLSNGTTSPVSVTYSATGGTVSSSGMYQAGTTPGKFRVVARSAAGLADTAVVTIPAPDLQQIVLTPASVSLDAGATYQFAANGSFSDGTSQPVSVTFSATGGTISSTGLYTAGNAGGTYRVIAASSGLADTSAVILTASSEPPSSPPPAPDADGGAGVNGQTGFNTASNYVSEVNAKASGLGLSSLRMGMDGVYGNAVGANFTFGTRDAVVNSHLSAGLAPHAVISFRNHVSHGSSQAEWLANWRYFVGGVMRHYDGKVRYYIIDNEPELNGFTDAAFAVTLTKAAFDSAAAIDPAIRIESPPTGSPGTAFLQQMINAGITRYAHVLGVHAYGGQIDDAHGQGLRKPWEWMAASGYRVIPVACSECGASAGWAPAGVDGRTWQARWMRAAAVAFRRYGYDNVQLYSFRSTAGADWDIASWDGSRLVPNAPTYDAVQQAFGRIRAFANGGFEDANDRELEWTVVFNPDQATPAEWSRVQFVNGDASAAHSGDAYLKFLTGASSSPNKVRRLASVTPGRLTTLSAWVRITGGGTATLRALGYQRQAGTQEAAQSTNVRDNWQHLSVSFTPTASWVVINLEGTGGSSGQHMEWDDVTLSN